MDIFLKYAKKFAIGATVGLGVSLGMALFGAAGMLGGEAFFGTALANPIYSSVFFGVIQVSAAIGAEITTPLLDRLTGSKPKDLEKHIEKDEDIFQANDKAVEKPRSQHSERVTHAEYDGQLAAALERMRG